jgi:hypothetical protein
MRPLVAASSNAQPPSNDCKSRHLGFRVDSFWEPELCHHAFCRHVEVNGHEFPFSRGASFYELNSQGKILYGRDLVEPALKPGSSALLVSSIASPCASIW